MRGLPVVRVRACAQASAMTPVELAERITESDSVRHWRLEELERAGYTPLDALVLSGRPDIDLHLAVEMLEQGCPTETAMRILL